jgi:hypothetical protein
MMIFAWPRRGGLLRRWRLMDDPDMYTQLGRLAPVPITSR